MRPVGIEPTTYRFNPADRLQAQRRAAVSFTPRPGEARPKAQRHTVTEPQRRWREQEPPRKHRAAVALVATPPVALAVTPSLPPGPQRIDYGAVIRRLEMRAGLIADAVPPSRAGGKP